MNAHATMLLRLIYAFVCINSSFFFIGMQYCIEWIDHNLFALFPFEVYWVVSRFLSLGAKQSSYNL